jgi:hypothetical protein
MIQNSNMILKVSRFVVQILLTALFFFPIVYLEVGAERVEMNAIDAIIKGDYLILGNVVIAFVLLGVILHLISLGVGLIHHDLEEKMESWMNLIVNLTVIFGLVMTTFLGTFLTWWGYGLIACLIVSTYLRYMEQKTK